MIPNAVSVVAVAGRGRGDVADFDRRFSYHDRAVGPDAKDVQPFFAGGGDCPPNRFYAYGVIARLALVAAALELEQTEPAVDVRAIAPVRAVES